ncbi:sugar transferase [Jannaschia pohangensis]|uniref:Sugar transferase involved in LPS biosynthesis (Colanic, teichoic acid) n=1 Tax=Jannaschia pohangensis TaxID=390807 RepID=A0A1I3QU45_9RHOB|nr:sugar transferase [Jannaschia pohangensis]SFJ37260.1 Sugar transferase involved in LPS biosynthesis (colanic, teichoic acid) [Jannaschia pohangensis]
MKTADVWSSSSAEGALSTRPIAGYDRNAGIASPLKRAFDVAFAIVLLPILVPVIAVLYILTRLDGGPGFFGHRRIGKDGAEFRCWKIRSMVVDAKSALAKHLAENPDAAAEWARDFKLADDPRITPLGRFLRRTSLDELPQIWNVLCGEMSFVGPRPVTAEELGKYRTYKHCYLSVKPGITGVWQVSGRGEVDYDTRVAMDVAYFRNHNLLNDISIIARTAGVMLRRTGQ